KLPYSFIIKQKTIDDGEATTRYFAFPPPKIWTTKNMSYFQSFVKKNLGYETLLKHYNNFIESNFEGGSLGKLISGKDSHMRKKILAFSKSGLRFPIVVDSRLPPGTVA